MSSRQTTATENRFLVLLIVAHLLMGAATGLNTNQAQTGVPSAIPNGGNTAVEGTSIKFARADHIHPCVTATGSVSGCLSSTDWTAFNAKVSGYPLLAPDGLVGTPSYSWANETNSGWYRIGAHDYGFAITGTKLLELTSTVTLDVTGDAANSGVTIANFCPQNRTWCPQIWYGGLRAAGSNGANTLSLQGQSTASVVLGSSTGTPVDINASGEQVGTVGQTNGWRVAQTWQFELTNINTGWNCGGGSQVCGTSCVRAAFAATNAPAEPNLCQLAMHGYAYASGGCLSAPLCTGANNTVWITLCNMCSAVAGVPAGAVTAYVIK